jgi:hypothetical protein
LPKSWGNIVPGKRSALWAFLLLCGCSPDPEPDRVLEVRAHLPASLAEVGPDLSVELLALGDFEASTATTKIAPGDANGAALPFPAQTRGVSAEAKAGAAVFLGMGHAGDDGSIDFLLYRRDDATRLWPAPTSSFPSEAAGVGWGVDARGRTLLAAGSLVDSTDAGRAFVIDLATGAAREVPDGMLPARAFASVTAFGAEALLVAGGADPTVSLTDAPALDSASVFSLRTGRFDRSSVIALAQPRARHAAVVLTSGDTLLVGGAGPNGIPLATLEAVSPKDQASKLVGLAKLAHARVDPTALRLTDGRVFVGGGSAGGVPVHSLEWLTADGSARSVIQENVVLAPSAAFARMPGGSVLAVGVCVPKTLSACAGDLPSRSVTWFRADGTADILPPLGFSPSGVRFVDGSAGEPWLYSRVGSKAVWRRFDPWTGELYQPERAPRSGPVEGAAAPLAVDSGAFVWLEPGELVTVSGFRHGVRGPFARDIAPLLIAGREHVAPSRLPTGVASSGIEYSADGLGLRGAEALAVVADTDYADVDLTLTLTSGPAPVVVLGSTRLGGAECPFGVLEAATPGEVITVRRRGATATLERRGTRRKCAVESGRLGVALSASGPSASFVRALELRRP